MRFNVTSIYALALLLASMAATPVYAQTLQVTLDPSTLTGPPGIDLVTSGSLFNGTPNTLYLNGFSVAPIAGADCVDESPFIFGPSSLAPGEDSGLFDFFRTTWSAGASGSYDTHLTITASANKDLPFSPDLSWTYPFTLTVGSSPPAAVVPEGSSMALLLAGALAPACFLLKIRRRRAVKLAAV
jgi:hypothetical protein